MHDPVCPCSEIPDSGCLCPWLGDARADERERIARAVMNVWVLSWGAYSDETVIAVFDSLEAAMMAAYEARDKAWNPRLGHLAMRLELFTVQGLGGAFTFDGGTDIPLDELKPLP